MSSRTAVKALQTKLATLQTDLKVLKAQQSELAMRINSKQQQITAVNAEIKKLESADLILSEHALLRFIERTQLLNLQDVEASILTDSLRAQIKALGDGEYPLGEYRAVVRNNTIVTIK